MEIEQAHDVLSELYCIVARRTGKFDSFIMATAIAISAIEKKMPKHPEKMQGILGKNYSWLKCPSCGHTLPKDRHEYCNYCGQHINWIRTEKGMDE